MATNSRRLRGRRTELVVATYFQRFWGRAEAVGSGASGSDIKNTPFDIEVKARAAFQPKAWIDQQKKRDDGRLKFVVMRCNGQGENPEDYVFIETAIFLAYRPLVRASIIRSSTLLSLTTPRSSSAFLTPWL